MPRVVGKRLFLKEQFCTFVLSPSIPFHGRCESVHIESVPLCILFHAWFVANYFIYSHDKKHNDKRMIKLTRAEEPKQLCIWKNILLSQIRKMIVFAQKCSNNNIYFGVQCFTIIFLPSSQMVKCYTGPLKTCLTQSHHSQKNHL